MRYVLEFGVRGGAHVENEIVNTREQAERLARRLVMVFTNDPHGATDRDFVFSKHTTRFIWKSETHFVAVSKLDGKPRGPASATVWREAISPEMLVNTISEYFD